MTTTVTVEAHCDEKTEVVIVKHTDNENKEILTIQDGEKWDSVVYDDISINVMERPKQE